MPVITLTSDWNGQNYYAAAIKGFLLRHILSVQIADISHQIAPFNLAQAAFVLRNSYQFFPPGTIHLLCLRTDLSANEQFIIYKVNGHYFITVDNGVMGLVSEREAELVVAIETDNDLPESALFFPELYIMAPVAYALANGQRMEEFGPEVKKPKRQLQFNATIENSAILGRIIYIDSYKNAVCNISRALFERIGQGRDFTIIVQSYKYQIKRINRHYNETAMGELFAIFNSLNLLEIGMYRGNAAEILKLDTDSSVRVKFEKND